MCKAFLKKECFSKEAKNEWDMQSEHDAVVRNGECNEHVDGHELHVFGQELHAAHGEYCAGEINLEGRVLLALLLERIMPFRYMLQETSKVEDDIQTGGK